MKSEKKILLTGGGSTGHVSVNLALIPILKRDGWDIYYMGSKNGIEKELITKIDGVKYLSISTGKFRRYFSFENFKDIFKVFIGSIQAVFKIRKIKPDVVFSKGGFVSVPVLFGAKVNKIPSLSHESDLTPGLANKIAQKFVNKIFTTFKDTPKYIKSGKGEYIGPVIRESLFNGDKQKAKEFLLIKNDKPCILAMGGSLGAFVINKSIRENIFELLQKFNIVHVCGKGGTDSSYNYPGYFQFEYINEELKDILDYSDIIVSRAGSNAIFEFLYYKKPMLLIPLDLDQSRGDQIENAKNFEQNGYAKMIREKDITNKLFLDEIFNIYENRQKYSEKMKDINFHNNIKKIYDEINLIKL